MRRNSLTILTVFAFAVAIGAMGWVFANGRRPGRLVADKAFLEWVSPPPTENGGIAYEASTQFNLVNTGGQPVRILSTLSGCGCAKPKVEPSVVDPGRAAKVSVSATPMPVGSRDVTFTIKTDSPVTPEVELNFRMIGSRRPPFLLRVTGDLTFLGPDDLHSGKAFEVIEIEGPETPKTRPKFEIEPKFLEFEILEEQSKPYTTADSFQRIYKCRLFARQIPDDDTFVGALRVLDTWNSGAFDQLPIHGETREAVSFSPKTIVFDRLKKSESLIVRTLEPSLDLAVDFDKDSSRFFTIELDGDRQTDRFHRFRIGLKAEANVAPGVYRLEIKTPKNGREVATVDVRVTDHESEAKP